MNVKSKMKRILSGFLAILMVAALFAAWPLNVFAATAEEHTVNVSTIENEYLKSWVDHGSLYLHTTGGDPNSATDNDARLLYNGTSQAVIRVGNITFSFSPSTTKATADGNSLYSVSTRDDVKVERYISFVYNTYTGRNDTVEYKYVLTNMASQPQSAGARLFFDTMLGNNDRAPFRVLGQNVTSGTTYTGSDIPQTWQVFDSFSNPTVVASGTFYNDVSERPDKVQFLTYGDGYGTQWDCVSPGTIGDSAVNVYFDPDTLQPGESRTVKTYYGLSAFQPAPEPEPDPDPTPNPDPRPVLGLSAIAPTSLLPSDDNLSYLGNPFTFSAWVTNSGNATATDVTVTIALPEGMSTTDHTVNVGTLAAGGEAAMTWMVTVDNSAVDKSFEYTVTVSADGVEPLVGTYTLSIPALVHTHNHVEISRTEPTCTEPGQVFLRCDCGDETTLGLDALGHTPGEWVVITEPTATEPGLKQKTCLVCGEIAESETIPVISTPTVWVDAPDTVIFGQEITFNVVVAGTDPVYALALTPIYDSTVFELVSVSWQRTALLQAIEEGSLRSVSAWDSLTDVNGIVYSITLRGIAYTGATTVDCVFQLQDVNGMSTLPVTAKTVAVIECPHTSETCVSVDDSIHAYICDVCGRRVETAHGFDNACDPDCNDCEYVRNVSHDWSSPAIFNSTHHWYACNVCGETRDEGEHVYDTVCDGTCDVCDYTRPPQHVWGPTQYADADYHWIQCEICGEKDMITDHVYTSDCDGVCDVCSYERLGAEFILRVDEYTNVKAGALEIFYDPAVFQIINAQWMINDTVIQDFVLSNGVGAFAFENPTTLSGNVIRITVRAVDTAAWRMALATLSAQLILEDGDGVYTTVTLDRTNIADVTPLYCHLFTVKNTDSRYLATEATCTAPATYYYSCARCGEADTNTTFADGEPLSHTYDHNCDDTCNDCGFVREAPHEWRTEYIYSTEDHWYDCLACGAIRDEAAHVYDNHCDVTCNECSYEREAPHEWSNEYVHANGETHWIVCTACGVTRDEATHSYDTACDAICNDCGFERIPPHEWGTDYVHMDGETHWIVCLLCGETRDEAAHVYDGDCDASCNDCGFERIPPHVWSTEYTNDEHNHWHVCTGCGAIDREEAHEYSHALDIVCNACGYQRLMPGDVDNDNDVDANDATYLLYEVFFGAEDYPVYQSLDFDGNDSEDSNDAVYLLYYVLYPNDYPLNLD